MATVKKPYFHYHANAHALSGRIHRPVQHLIEVQAASSLPTTGGHGHARVDDFRFNEFVSLKAAYSHVSGSEQEDNDRGFHTTLATVTVEQLNLFDVVTADRIVARLASSFEFGDPEPKIVMLGSRFDNLQIAGCPVTVTFHHDLLFKLDTFAAIKKEFASNKEFRKMTEDPFQSGHKNELKVDRVFLCSLVKEIQTDCPGITVVGCHGLRVPKFGTIYLGEVLVGHGKRTLTMLRFELGSPVSGSGTVTQLDVNGHHWP
jgi:hypothetical protein